MSARACAIILAAGEGRRMDQDKALLELGGETAVERVVGACERGGARHVLVVRRPGAAALPPALSGRVQVVEAAETAGMIDSLRAGLRARPADVDAVLVFPVDHALVGHEVVATVLAQFREGGPAGSPAGGPAIVLPLWQDRPGHPMALATAIEPEILDPGCTSLREVVRADSERVAGIAVSNSWVRRDLDTPEDLEAARQWLVSPQVAILEQMHRHRSRRSFHPDALPDGLLERLVDAARHASTSAFIQAYAVVAVRNPENKAAAAALCADQRHIHEAPVFCAICADLHKIARSCERHGTTLNPDSLEVFVEATIDAALVGQNLQLGAEAHGLGACMIGAAREHPIELAKLLGLPPHVFVVFGMVLGYPSDDPVPRGRMPLEGVLHHERYATSSTDAVLDAADEGMRAWARRINAERGGYLGRPVNEQKGWSDRMAVRWSREKGRSSRDDLQDELRALGFGLE